MPEKHVIELSSICFIDLGWAQIKLPVMSEHKNDNIDCTRVLVGYLRQLPLTRGMVTKVDSSAHMMDLIQEVIAATGGSVFTVMQSALITAGHPNHIIELRRDAPAPFNRVPEDTEEGDFVFLYTGSSYRPYSRP